MHQRPEEWMERISPEEYSAQPYHISRYKFAANYVVGKSVLDIACGVGYGSWMLSYLGARNVIGIDVERAAIEQSRSVTSFKDHDNPCFSVGSATVIPLRDRSIEVIVSIETIEHILDVDKCLSELRRVLTDDGLLILSTPNALFTKPCNGIPRNPFHIKEFEPSDLGTLLQRHFSSVDLLGQRVREVNLTEKGGVGYRGLLQRALSLFPLKWRQELPKLLPRSLADPLVIWVTGHHTVLATEDLEFNSENIERSPVIIALCRK